MKIMRTACVSVSLPCYHRSVSLSTARAFSPLSCSAQLKKTSFPVFGSLPLLVFSLRSRMDAVVYFLSAGPLPRSKLSVVVNCLSISPFKYDDGSVMPVLVPLALASRVSMLALGDIDIQ